MYRLAGPLDWGPHPAAARNAGRGKQRHQVAPRERLGHVSHPGVTKSSSTACAVELTSGEKRQSAARAPRW